VEAAQPPNRLDAGVDSIPAYALALLDLERLNSDVPLTAPREFWACSERVRNALVKEELSYKAQMRLANSVLSTQRGWDNKAPQKRVGSPVKQNTPKKVGSLSKEKTTPSLATRFGIGEERRTSHKIRRCFSWRIVQAQHLKEVAENTSLYEWLTRNTKSSGFAGKWREAEVAARKIADECFKKVLPNRKAKTTPIMGNGKNREAGGTQHSYGTARRPENWGKNESTKNTRTYPFRYGIYTKAIRKWGKAPEGRPPSYEVLNKKNLSEPMSSYESYESWARQLSNVYKRDAHCCTMYGAPQEDGFPLNPFGQFIHGLAMVKRFDEVEDLEEYVERVGVVESLTLLGMQVTGSTIGGIHYGMKLVSGPVRKVVWELLKKIPRSCSRRSATGGVATILNNANNDTPGGQGPGRVAVFRSYEPVVFDLEEAEHEVRNDLEFGGVYLENPLGVTHQSGQIRPEETIRDTTHDPVPFRQQEELDLDKITRESTDGDCQPLQASDWMSKDTLAIWDAIKEKAYEFGIFSLATLSGFFSLPISRMGILKERTVQLQRAALDKYLRALKTGSTELAKLRCQWRWFDDIVTKISNPPVASGDSWAWYETPEGNLAFKTRNKVKPAWAPLLFGRDPSKLSHAKLRMPTLEGHQGAQVVVKSSYEEALEWHSRIVADSMGMDPSEIITRAEVVRTFNQNPYVDNHLKTVKETHPLFDGVNDGMDGLLIADRETVWDSMQRYGPRMEPENLSNSEIDRIASAMFWRNPGLYAHAQLTPLNKVVKNLKASPGYPLLFIKQKRDLRRQKTLMPILNASRNTLAYDTVAEGISHVFPKSQAVWKDKLLIPGKLRTIVGVGIVSQTRGRIINGDINDRRDPWNAPGKPGMPMTGRAFNEMYKASEHHTHHYSLDGTKYDSTVARQVVKVSSRLRKMGYEWHPDAEHICRAIEAIEETVAQSHLVNLCAAKVDDPLRHMYKMGGIATGHESVTEDNTQTLQVTVVATLCRLWHVTPEFVIDAISLENTGDDNFLHCSREIDQVEFKRIAKELTGVEFRFEDAKKGSLEGIEFLAKTGYLMQPSDIDELERFDINTDGLKYKVVHNRDTLRMRYVTLRQDGHTRMSMQRPFSRAQYMLQRIAGYALLTAHQRDLYDFLSEEREYYISKVPEQLQEKLRKDKALKFPTYRKVMQLWYAPLPKDENKKGLVPVWLAYWDAANIEGYKLDRTLRKTRNWMMGLDPEFWDLPDVPIHHLPGAMQAWLPTFEVEEFIYFRQLEWSWPTDQELGPDHESAFIPIVTEELMTSLVKQSPFMGCTDVPAFCMSVIPRLEKEIRDSPNPYQFVIRQCVRTRFRMSILSFLYSALTLATSAIPAGWMSVAPLVMDIYYGGLRRLYSWMSYAYWLDKGRGSPVISNMAPKDQFGVYKLGACKLLHMIPRNFSLPDLLPFLALDFGDVIEKGAKGITFLQGLATTRKGHGKEAISDHSNNEVALRSETWFGVTVELLNELQKTPNRAIILDAPTGSGKTFFFPQQTTSNHILHTGMVVAVHIILVPTRILAQETKVPGIKWVRRQNPGLQPGINVMTYGYARAIWPTILSCTIPNLSIVQLDEFHFQEPDQLWISDAAKKARYWRIISTATPVLGMDREEFARYRAQVKGAHEVLRYNLAGYEPTRVFHSVMTSAVARERGFTDRILLIHPSLQECDKICESLRVNARAYGDSFAVNVIHAGNRVVPKTGHIIATQMVDAGVTISGISCVIDSGLSTVTHKGTLQTVRCTKQTSIQRAGRTGRTRPGLYISCLSSPESSEPDRYPSVLDAMAATEAWNLRGRYNFTTSFLQWDDIPAGKHRIHPYIVADIGHTQRWYRSIRIWYEIMCQYSQLDLQDCLFKARNDYRSLREGRPLPSVEHLFQSEFNNDRDQSESLEDPLDMEKEYTDGGVWLRTLDGYVSNRPAFQGSHISHSGPTESLLDGKPSITRRDYETIYRKETCADKIDNLLRQGPVNATDNIQQAEPIIDEFPPYLGDIDERWETDSDNTVVPQESGLVTG